MLELINHLHIRKAAPTPYFLVGILHALSFSFIIVTLPLYIKEFGGNAQIIGIAFAIFAVMKLIFSLLGGYLSQFVRKTSILRISIVMFTIAGLFYYFATNYYVIFVGKFFQGIAAGLFWMSITTLIENGSKEKASILGLFESSRSVISLVAVVLSGFIVSMFSIKLTMLIFVIVFATNVLISQFVVGKEEVEKKVKSTFKHDIGKFVRLNMNIIPTLVAMGFFFGFEEFLPLYGLEIGMSYIELGYLKVCTLVGFVFAPYLSGRFSDRVSRKVPIVVSNVVTIICLSLLFSVKVKIVVGLLLFLISVSIVGTYPSIVATINDRSSKQDSGAYNSMIIAMKNLAFIFAALITGYMFAYVGYQFYFLVLIGVYLVALVASLRV